MTFFSCRLFTTPIFPRRLSSVLSKFGHRNNFRLGVTPWRVSPGGGPPPPLVTPLEGDIPLRTFFSTDSSANKCLTTLSLQSFSYITIVVVPSACDVVNPSNRVNCGYPGITRDSCIQNGCCWDTRIYGVPWCYLRVSQSPWEQIINVWMQVCTIAVLFLPTYTPYISDPRHLFFAILRWNTPEFIIALKTAVMFSDGHLSSYAQRRDSYNL